MQNASRIPVVLVSVILLLLLAALSAFADMPTGEWVYPDTPDQTVLSVSEDGSFLFEGQRYTVQADEDFCFLRPEDETLPVLRCRLSEDTIVIYRQLEYVRHPNDKGSGLPGAWLCTTGNSVFILGSDGLFMEDGIFTGSYTVDGENHSFRLIYDKSFGFADTVCYFRFNEEALVIEYPWKLIRKP